MTPSEPQPLTPAVFHILLALSDGPAHGYGVMRRVEETSGLEMGPGTIYGSIGRLVDAGWIDPVAASSSDPRRGKSFELTEAGRAALRAEAARIARLAELEPVRRLATEAGS